MVANQQPRVEEATVSYRDACQTANEAVTQALRNLAIKVGRVATQTTLYGPQIPALGWVIGCACRSVLAVLTPLASWPNARGRSPTRTRRGCIIPCLPPTRPWCSGPSLSTHTALPKNTGRCRCFSSVPFQQQVEEKNNRLHTILRTWAVVVYPDPLSCSTCKGFGRSGKASAACPPLLPLDASACVTLSFSHTRSPCR